MNVENQAGQRYTELVYMLSGQDLNLPGAQLWEVDLKSSLSVPAEYYL